MKNRKYLVIFLITNTLSLCGPTFASGQSFGPAMDICYDTNIHTILLHRTEWDLSMPVMRPNESKALELHYDYLDAAKTLYSYSVTHCTYNWEVDGCLEHEYLDGFNDVPIYNARQAMNTTKPYTHFSVSVPEEDLKIIKSGNYLLKVYQSNDPEKVAFTKRFCVSEKLVEIVGFVRKPDLVNQELALEIHLQNLKLTNPLAEIKISVIKNYDWNNQIKIASASFLRDNILYIDLPYQVVSEGGNEFRYVDIKNTEFISDRLESIDFQNPYFHFYLKKDGLRQFTPYFSSEDLNGRFYIDVPGAHERHEEADYVYVHFRLQTPLLGTDVYIYGALTQYKTDELNYMTYNFEEQCYVKTLFLKQGHYNYAYLTKDYNKERKDFDITEGNHSETENDYIVFVYLKSMQNDFDRLIGYRVINSAEFAK